MADQAAPPSRASAWRVCAEFPAMAPTSSGEAQPGAPPVRCPDEREPRPGLPGAAGPGRRSIVQALPAARIGPSGSATASNSRTWRGLVVAGEAVVIPSRIYSPARSPHLASALSPAELAVTAAIYSRHADGRVRQRALGTLLDFDEPWTAPFIVQLLGEYVIQICADIETFTRTALPGRPAMQASLWPSPCRTPGSPS